MLLANLLRRALIVLALASTACTIVFGTVGASFSRTMPIAPQHIEAVPPGAVIEIDGHEGRFLGVHRNLIVLETASGPLSLQRDHVGSITYIDRGAYTGTAIFVGAVIDITLLIGSIAMLASPPGFKLTME